MTLRRHGLALAILAYLALGAPVLAAEKLRILIIDGQNNHNWKAMTPPMKDDLEKTGPVHGRRGDHPRQEGAEVGLGRVPPRLLEVRRRAEQLQRRALARARSRRRSRSTSPGGGGLVDHPRGEQRLRGLARVEQDDRPGLAENTFGDRVTVDDARQGRPHAQGRRARARATARSTLTRSSSATPTHPITQGMPAEWMHAKDELYHGQRGPAEDMEILATAYSDKDKGGTGTNEPMIWVIPYGKGRVFTTVMGHVDGQRRRRPSAASASRPSCSAAPSGPRPARSRSRSPRTSPRPTR